MAKRHKSGVTIYSDINPELFTYEAPKELGRMKTQFVGYGVNGSRVQFRLNKDWSTPMRAPFGISAYQGPGTNDADSEPKKTIALSMDEDQEEHIRSLEKHIKKAAVSHKKVWFKKHLEDAEVTSKFMSRISSSSQAAEKGYRPIWRVDVSAKHPPVMKVTTWKDGTFVPPRQADENDLQKGDYVFVSVRAKGGIWFTAVGYGIIYEASEILIVKGFAEAEGGLGLDDLPICKEEEEDQTDAGSHEMHGSLPPDMFGPK